MGQWGLYNKNFTLQNTEIKCYLSTITFYDYNEIVL